MRREIKILLTALIAMIASPAQGKIEIASGVDKELAKERKEKIADLRYNLSFNIPECRDEAVEGSIELSMNLSDKSPLVLDFKSEAGGIYNVDVNGKACRDYEYRNEHIVIPSKRLKIGNNQISITFRAGDKPLNRNEDYLYTLLVPDRARTLFPCFDQPDLKAEYTLTLEVPTGWEVVSNTVVTSRTAQGNRNVVNFAPTEPLSTYLFSFVAGRFDKRTAKRGEREISAYYRETDPVKLSQLDRIFDEVFYALEWQEEYTGIAYPFAKYDLIILPGFQFGGMEHTGATLYNDIRMWLGETPTLEEELERSLLIAHETSHMWFGDLVTMAWFDDVWTKEVFANYYAAEITDPLFPEANHSLNRLRTFYTPSLNEDRTLGSTPILQSLDNLQYAGLVYNNIIYDKAPVMMSKLVEIMGKENFRAGIREYLQRYSYSNATWDNLVEILDSHTDADLKQFCKVWVTEKGMPEISFEIEGKDLIVSQRDPLGRDLMWPQKFEVTALCDTIREDVEVELYSKSVRIPLGFTPRHVLANTDGRGYAYFSMRSEDLDYMMRNWAMEQDLLVRQTMLMTIYENYLHHKVDVSRMVDSFLSGMDKERDPLIVTSLVNYLEYVAIHSASDICSQIEQEICRLSKSGPAESVRLQLRRMLSRIMTTDSVINDIYSEWEKHEGILLSDNDYTDFAYELAIRLPERSEEILSTQRSRIRNIDKLRAFDFISRACLGDEIRRDSLFAELLTVEGRSNEAYAKKALGYLNHFTRNSESVKYIRPGLEALEGVRAVGDIFFPGGWCKSLLSGHTGAAAREVVDEFLRGCDYPELLRNKILLAAYPLYQ